jgi:integral membrane sensor domain MASE1
MILSAYYILVILAMIFTLIYAGNGKVPLWIPVLLLAIALLIPGPK